MRNYGAGLSPDSVGYIAAARNMAAGIGIVSYYGTPILSQPPLYPGVLAFIDHIFGIDPLLSAPIVNASLFGAIIFLAGLLFIRHLQAHFAFAHLCIVSVLFSIPLIYVSLMAWSETLFISLMLLYFIFSESYLAKGDKKSLLVLSVSVALMCLTRYIGVIFIITGIVSVLFIRQDNLPVKIKHSLTFVFVSAFPVIVWLIRNYHLSGTLMGSRAPSIFTLPQNLAFTFNTILSWYFPITMTQHIVVLILFIAVIVFSSSLAVKKNYAEIKSVLTDKVLFLISIIAYAGFLLVSSTSTAYDQINNRLLSPIYIPLTLLLISFASLIIRSITQKWLSHKWVKILPSLMVGVWLVYPALVTNYLITREMTQGSGYSGMIWRNSQTIHYLVQNQKLMSECVIYTNGPDVLYILANLSSKMSPQKTMHNSPQTAQNLSDLKSQWPEESNSCLVWLDNVDRNYLFTVDELMNVSDLYQIVHLDDGAMYYIKRK
jgi:hypothetical protein